jgi:hypothetical protein
MAIQMQTSRFDFPPAKLREQFQNQSFFFNGTVQSAVVMVQGFNVRFNNGDHHLLEEEIRLSVIGLGGRTVNVQAAFLLRDDSRDSSGLLEDPFSGSISAVVIADVN